MKTFEQHINAILLEMARPAKSFDDPFLNNAYSESLKKFKQMNIYNANTYTIWDFIFRLLPKEIKTPEMLEAKSKASGQYQRPFVQSIILTHKINIDTKKLAHDMNNFDYIKQYLNRSDVGNRQKGKIKSQTSELTNMEFQDPLI